MNITGIKEGRLLLRHYHKLSYRFNCVKYFIIILSHNTTHNKIMYQNRPPSYKLCDSLSPFGVTEPDENG